MTMPDDATPAPLDGKASANDAKVRRQTAVTPAPLDLDGKPFCPTGYAQRYHAIGECECATPAPLDVERLARALRELFPKAQTNQWPFTVEQVAAAIAAAYAGEAERKPDLTNLNVLIGPEIVPIPKSLR